MFHVKPKTLGFMTLGVWLAAVGSAAALSYELKRPPVPLDEETPPPISSPAAEAVVVWLPQTDPQAQDVLLISETTIVGAIPRGVKPLALTPAPAYKDITEMHCAEWRELSAGSGHVQICD
jgi:hypothetical protein